MAYNEITLPKWQDLVRRRFGLVGPGGNVPVLASEIQPVVMVEPSLFEHELLRDVIHYQRAEVRSVGLNHYGSIALLNPVGSGKFAVLYETWGWYHCLFPPANFPVNLNPYLYMNDENTNPQVTGFLAGPLYARSVDSRRLTVNLGACSQWTDTRAAPPAYSNGFGFIPAEYMHPNPNQAIGAVDSESRFWHDKPYLLQPGTSLILQVGLNNVGNNLFGAAFRWYEFPVEQAELRV